MCFSSLSNHLISIRYLFHVNVFNNDFRISWIKTNCHYFRKQFESSLFPESSEKVTVWAFALQRQVKKCKFTSFYHACDSHMQISIVHTRIIVSFIHSIEPHVEKNHCRVTRPLKRFQWLCRYWESEVMW